MLFFPRQLLPYVTPGPAALSFLVMAQWTRDAVAQRILQGETLIIYQGHLLNIPQKWQDAHPGGSLALLHFVGRDATDEIHANHSDLTLHLIPRYSQGPVELTEHGWLPLVPPIATGWVRQQQVWVKEAEEVYSTEHSQFLPSSSIILVQKNGASCQPLGPTLASLQPPPSQLSLEAQGRHSKAWRDLHDRVIAAGLYQTHYVSGYGPEILRYTLLAAISAYAYSLNWLITSAVFLGLLWHQLAFAAHDLGHMGVTHDWTKDRLIAIIIADFIGGLSIGWWVQVCPLLLIFKQLLIF